MQWWRSLLLGAGAVWLVVLAARCHLPRRTVSAGGGPDSTGVIYVVQHGWHAGIAVRRADVPAGRWPVLDDVADAPYVEVGWGEAQYYPGASATSSRTGHRPAGTSARRTAMPACQPCCTT